MKSTIIVIFITIFACSCVSMVMDDRPYDGQTVHLSKLSETTIEFDSSRFAGLTLTIINDSDSDIFLRRAPTSEYMYDIEPDTVFRFPDTEERNRRLNLLNAKNKGVILNRQVDYVEVFSYIWAGNKEFFAIYPSSDVCFFEIVYYDCNDKGFYKKTLKVIKSQQPLSP